MKDKRQRIKKKAVYILLISMIFITGCANERTEGFTELELEESSEPASKDTEETESPERDRKQTVFVYVCGAVHAPGVYELPEKARIYEAIEAAGGTKEGAAGEYLNQAQIVADGEQIYIPTKEELEKGIVEGQGPKVTGTDSNTEGKININTAPKDELKTLPGIGDAKADSIISYRETNGAFQQVEDLMQVEGIKEGVFNKIKSIITV